MPTRRTVIAAGAGLGVLSRTGRSQQSGHDGWPMVQRDARNTGVASSVRPPSSALTATSSVSVGGPLSAAPVSLDGTLYAAREDGVLHALDIDTDETLWTFDTEGTTNLGIAAGPDHVFAGTQDGASGDGTAGGTFYAVDRREGTRAWRHDTDAGIQCPPTVIDGTAFVADQRGIVYAFDVSDGTVEWTRPTDGPIVSPPAVDSDRVYVRHRRGPLLALDRSTGRRQWAAPVELDGFGGPVVAHDRVFVSGFVDSSGVVAAVDRTAGEVAWRRSFPDGVLLGPAVTEQRVLVDEADGLHALDPADGSEQWRTPAEGAGAVVATSNHVFTLSRATLGVFDAETGSNVEQFSIDAEFEWYPLVTGDAIYVPVDDGRILTVQRRSGPSLTDIGIGTGVLGALLYAGHRAYRRGDSP